MASGLLLLMFFPGIIRQGSGSYLRATGLTQQPYLGRWLLLTGAFFAVSAVSYAAATVRVRHRRATAVTPSPPSSDEDPGATVVAATDGEPTW
jgi:hypothetical protein